MVLPLVGEDAPGAAPPDSAPAAPPPAASPSAPSEPPPEQLPLMPSMPPRPPPSAHAEAITPVAVALPSGSALGAAVETALATEDPLGASTSLTASPSTSAPSPTTRPAAAPPPAPAPALGACPHAQVQARGALMARALAVELCALVLGLNARALVAALARAAWARVGRRLGATGTHNWAERLEALQATEWGRELVNMACRELDCARYVLPCAGLRPCLVRCLGCSIRGGFATNRSAAPTKFAELTLSL